MRADLLGCMYHSNIASTTSPGTIPGLHILIALNFKATQLIYMKAWAMNFH